MPGTAYKIMSLQQFVLFLIRQTFYAAGSVLVIMLGLEWLMPGSVLPFFNLMDFLPWVTVMFVVILAAVDRKPGPQTVFSLIIGILTVVCLLGMVAAHLNNRLGMGLLPLSAGTICLAIWLVAGRRPT